jgi:hypothetical protein
MPIKKHSIEIYEYMALSRSIIATTRFNNKTYNENKLYRENKNHPFGCIYNGAHPVSQHIRIETDIYVLEMNNDSNRVMGIGKIRNDPIYNKYKIYQEEKYNVFSYIGNERIDRIDMTDKEEQIMKVFDILCFKGKRHLKRLKSIKTFPLDMLYNCKHVVDIVELIKNSFKTRFNNNIE